MSILKSRLYQYYEEQRDKEKKNLKNSKTEIGWGNQRSAVMFSNLIK